jgi:hypothetical protein
MCLRLSVEDIAALEARTEGWIAAEPPPRFDQGEQRGDEADKPHLT